LLKNCKKIAEGIDGVKSVSSLAGYEILTEGLVPIQELA
jgi:hypothetical protein